MIFLESALVNKLNWKPGLLITSTLVFIAVFHDQIPAALFFAASQLLFISPFIVIAMLVTGYLMASGAVNLLAKMFAGNQLKMIAIVSVVGALTPVCGLTVLPLVAGLLSAGIPIAPIMAFLLSSPITSPDMIVITAGTLGWSFAIGKSVAALAIGIFGGSVTLVLVKAGLFESPIRNEKRLKELSGSSDCNQTPQSVNWRYWQEPARRDVFFRSVLATSRLALIWLGIAFIAEYFLHLYLPSDLLVAYLGSESIFAVPLAATIGAPLYLDGYAALPLIRGLLGKGMSDGAAFTFLIAGGITSAWAAIPVFALVRNSLFSFYLVMAVLSSMLTGWMFGFLMG